MHHSITMTGVTMEQGVLFKDIPPKENNTKSIGYRLYLEFKGKEKQRVNLYHNLTHIKTVDLSDKVAKKLLVIEAVELGATKRLLAMALNISRQTIHNYLEIKKHFGLEGLIQGYSTDKSKSLRKHRKENAVKRVTGNKAQQVEQIRKQEREKAESQLELTFGDKSAQVEPEDQPFSQEHDWKATRYAGTFAYLITAITQNQWLRLVMGYFGDKYKVFLVFMLMVANNIRSIEQLKNVRQREAGLLLGIKLFPDKFKTRKWLYKVAQKKISKKTTGDNINIF